MSNLKIPFAASTDREYDVIGLGCATMDIVVQVPTYPAQNQKIHASHIERAGGGPTATALVVASRLGYKAAFIGQVGDDFAGNFTVAEFRRENVDVVFGVVQPKTRSQISLVIVDEKSGDRTIISARGELDAAGPSDLRINAVRYGKILHVDGYDMTAAIAAAKLAQELSLAVVYDCGSLKDGSMELLKYTDVAIVSEKFARQLVDSDDYERICKTLKAIGPEYVGVTLGKRGVWAMDDYSYYNVPAFDVPVVDTTGAGDVFHGAVNVGMLMGLEFEEILILASAVSAIKCGKFGGRAGIPDRTELKAFLNDRGYDFI